MPLPFLGGIHFVAIFDATTQNYQRAEIAERSQPPWNDFVVGRRLAVNLVTRSGDHVTAGLRKDPHQAWGGNVQTAEALERKMGDEKEPVNDPLVRFSSGLFGECARRNDDANRHAIAYRNSYSNRNSRANQGSNA